MIYAVEVGAEWVLDKKGYYWNIVVATSELGSINNYTNYDNNINNNHQ